MRTQPETRARSAQEAGKRALNLGASKANQACKVQAIPSSPSVQKKCNSRNCAAAAAKKKGRSRGGKKTRLGRKAYENDVRE